MSESQSEQAEQEAAADAEGLPAAEADTEAAEAEPAPTTFTTRADRGGYVELKSGRRFVGLPQAGAELTYPIEEKPDEA